MKPTISTAMIRRKVREVLAIRAGYGKTESMILEAVNELTGGGVSLQELRDAIEFNLSERYVRTSYDRDSETTLHFITEEGLAKQNVK